MTMPAARLPSKLGLKAGKRAILVGAPRKVASFVTMPDATFAKALTGTFDHIHAFFTSAARLDARFPKLKSHLAPRGTLWISWPKARQLGTDLTLKVIIGIGYRHGLVESKTIGIDATWSAIKFTFPKAGKVYQNSYGKLPE